MKRAAGIINWAGMTPAQHLKGIRTMSNTTYRLQTAAFPEDYADILMETLAITPDNFLSVKDALYHFRYLDDDQATEAMQRIAARIESNIDDLIRELLQRQRQVAHIWGIEDVQGIRRDLNEDQCWEVLQHVDHHKDAEIGITWLTLEYAAEHLFGDAPETDAAEEE
jgi:hypothetical protein